MTRRLSQCLTQQPRPRCFKLMEMSKIIYQLWVLSAFAGFTHSRDHTHPNSGLRVPRTDGIVKSPYHHHLSLLMRGRVTMTTPCNDLTRYCCGRIASVDKQLDRGSSEFVIRREEANRESIELLAWQ